MSMTNEPTTGEIVRLLCDVITINSFTEEELSVVESAIDRLESQEATIAELTARAESAEDKNEWRYALMKLINENPDIKCTSICDGDCIDCATSASGTARGFRLKSNLRGIQPQDGGKK